VELHSQRFGRSIHGWIACTSCGEKLEFDLDGRVLIAAGLDPDAGSQFDQQDKPIVVSRGSFRLPTSRDLASAAQEAAPRSAAIRIVENCFIAPQQPSETPSEYRTMTIRDPGSDIWSDRELEEIGERMAVADPLAETRLALHCPRCGSEWDETLDIVAFLWAEIEARARRLLLEIHTLASAYGWTETEILALSGDRRARYVEMVQS